MTSSLEYHISVRHSIPASLALFSLLALPLILVPASHAQINGVPASVTSPGFGGRAINGTPPSVTALGPNGFNFRPTFLPPPPNPPHARGKKMDDATLLKLYGDFELRSEQGKFHPYREVLESVVRQFAAELRFTPTAEEVRSLPDSLSTWKPWPDSVAALRQLKTRFRLAILSNVDDDLFAHTRPKLEVDFDEGPGGFQLPSLSGCRNNRRSGFRSG